MSLSGFEEVVYDADVPEPRQRPAKIAVIGYGIQGSAFANNLRDSGLPVCVGNIEDSYASQARADGFDVVSISDAAGGADVVLLLIPDEAHQRVFETQIRPSLSPGALIVVAHGYSLTYQQFLRVAGADVCLLAPRMFGRPIRRAFKAGAGVPAFYDVVQDCSGTARERVLFVAKSMGFTKAGVARVAYRDETVLDLFQEQFLTPALLEVLQVAFEALVASGIGPAAALMDMYASGEMGQMLLDAAHEGIYEIIEQQGSPTCQYGVFRELDAGVATSALRERADGIVRTILNGGFVSALTAAAETDYTETKRSLARWKRSTMSELHRRVREQIHYWERSHA